MRRATIYSSKPREVNAGQSVTQASGQPSQARVDQQRRWSGTRALIGMALLLVLLLATATWWFGSKSASDKPAPMSEAAVQAIVLQTLTTETLPSRPAQVAAAVWPSIVKIRHLDGQPPPPGLISEPGRGTGFVIKEDGTILTNYHVVSGSQQIVVTFFDGLESPAVIVATEPDRDLAVLAPALIPDDLEPVVLASSGQIGPGDLVIAVGFPFGMGPSVSAGVVSGLDRSYRIGRDRVLTGLIQFDAAVNPGSSGGPLVNQSGEVLGVVTALLNPAPAGSFSGIGFAIPMQSAANAAGIPPF